jgi:predicted RNA-binding protein with PUA-like domain
MKHWLVKSEPEVYSWDQFVKDKKTYWDGVRNYQARNNMREMEKGDLVIFYHSGDERSAVGIAEAPSRIPSHSLPSSPQKDLRTSPSSSKGD